MRGRAGGSGGAGGRIASSLSRAALLKNRTPRAATDAVRRTMRPLSRFPVAQREGRRDSSGALCARETMKV